MAVDENPPGGSEEDQVSYLGVPSDYKAKIPAKSTFYYDPQSMGEDSAPAPYTPLSGATEVAPKYRAGEEGRPASWGDERIVDLQSQMVDAGVLKANSYQRGVWDAASENAYAKLLVTANQSGLDVDQVLTNYRQVIAKYGRPEGADGAQRQPFVIQRRDPESLKSLLGAVSGRIMGGALSPEEMDRFVTTFNGMSEEAQRAEYVATGSGLPGGPGGIVTDVDPEAQAAKFLRESRPEDVVRHDVIERFDQFQSLLNKFQ